jgi:hypothetical protein
MDCEPITCSSLDVASQTNADNYDVPNLKKAEIVSDAKRAKHPPNMMVAAWRGLKKTLGGFLIASAGGTANCRIPLYLARFFTRHDSCNGLARRRF